MTEPITPPVHAELVEEDENARVIVDADGNIVCLTGVKYCDRLIDALNSGLARETTA